MKGLKKGHRQTDCCHSSSNDRLWPEERYMLGFGILCGALILGSIIVWLYLIELQGSAEPFLKIALTANAVLLLINVFRTLFIGFPDAFLRNTAIIYSLNVILHIICFMLFHIQILICPEKGATAVYYCAQSIIFLLLAILLSLLPSVAMGILMKIVAWLFSEQ